MTKSKKGFFTTPSGVERSILTVHGALLCEETIVLLGSQAQNIDFQQYDSVDDAESVFKKLTDSLLNGEVRKDDHFITLPNGNLLRRKQIQAIELITNAYEGYILRNVKDDIVDFIAESDEAKRELIKDELMKALEEKKGSRAKVYQPDWEQLFSSMKS